MRPIKEYEQLVGRVIHFVSELPKFFPLALGKISLNDWVGSPMWRAFQPATEAVRRIPLSHVVGSAINFIACV